MKTWRLRTTVTLIMFAAAVPASAQNLISNPYFEDRLDHWLPYDDSRAVWTQEYDFPDGGSMRPGSVDLVGPDFSFVEQCIDIDDAVVYVATARVFSTCVDQRLYLVWSDDACLAGPYAVARSTITYDWQQLTVVAKPTPGATKAIVMLENPGSRCDRGFFDDVYLQTDALFADGFERAP